MATTPTTLATHSWRRTSPTTIPRYLPEAELPPTFGQAYCTNFGQQVAEVTRGPADQINVSCPTCRDDDTNCYAWMGGGGDDDDGDASSTGGGTLAFSSTAFACFEVDALGLHLPAVPVCYTAQWHETASVVSDPPQFLTERLIAYYYVDAEAPAILDAAEPTTTTTTNTTTTTTTAATTTTTTTTTTTSGTVLTPPPAHGFLFRLTGNYEVGFGPCELIWHQQACLSCNPFCETETGDGFGLDCSNIHPQAVASCLPDEDYSYPFSPHVIAFLGQFETDLLLQLPQQQQQQQRPASVRHHFRVKGPVVMMGILMALLVGLLMWSRRRHPGRPLLTGPNIHSTTRGGYSDTNHQLSFGPEQIDRHHHDDNDDDDDDDQDEGNNREQEEDERGIVLL